jgi:hypothetical protein
MLLALLLKSSLQSTHMMLPVLTAFTAGTFGALVFVCANLVVDKDLREMALDKIGGKILKRR